MHYCVPILIVSVNGLRQLVSKEDIQQMCTFVELGHHYFISMYLDHDESIRSMNWDDVV